jgi:hypothetical protein
VSRFCSHRRCSLCLFYSSANVKRKPMICFGFLEVPVDVHFLHPRRYWQLMLTQGICVGVSQSFVHGVRLSPRVTTVLFQKIACGFCFGPAFIVLSHWCTNQLFFLLISTTMPIFLFICSQSSTRYRIRDSLYGLLSRGYRYTHRGQKPSSNNWVSVFLCNPISCGFPKEMP